LLVCAGAVVEEVENEDRQPKEYQEALSNVYAQEIQTLSPFLGCNFSNDGVPEKARASSTYT
jgi:hypothetical protein